MKQVNFMNCPEKIYETNAETYEKIKRFAVSVLKAGECGQMVKDFFLIDDMFWMWNKFCCQFSFGDLFLLRRINCQFSNVTRSSNTGFHWQQQLLPSFDSLFKCPEVGLKADQKYFKSNFPKKKLKYVKLVISN